MDGMDEMDGSGGIRVRRYGREWRLVGSGGVGSGGVVLGLAVQFLPENGGALVIRRG